MLYDNSPSSSVLGLAPDYGHVVNYEGSGKNEPPKQVLSNADIWRTLSVMAQPQREEFGEAPEIVVDSINFQPCRTVQNQDRYVVQELDIHGKVWSLTAVFDGHLGEATVEHAAYHLPVIITNFLRIAFEQRDKRSPAFISDLISKAISSFDDAIAGDVIDLFPGGLQGLAKLSDAAISRVLNDGGVNYQKARLCMYGTTALVVLVDPERENLFVANLGDCQAVLVSETANDWNVEVLTSPHNGSSRDEVERLESQHPGETECVQDGRVLGALGPFRCIGDVPFKQPPEFTRRILYNLYPGYHDTSPWEEFLVRNVTPPYISSQAEIVHRQLSPRATSTRRQFLVLHTDGLTDLCTEDQEGVFKRWAREMDQILRWEQNGGEANVVGANSSNMAMRLLKEGLGGEDPVLLSRVLLDVDEPSMDDTAIIVQTL